MATHPRLLSVEARLAVYVAAVVAALHAPEPAGPAGAVAALRTATDSVSLPGPSPIRLVIAALLLAGLLFELVGRRLRWH